MGGVRRYQDLLIWQKSMDLCEARNLLTAQLPTEERYGLAAQMRRASVSVPSNIAEGFARESKGVFSNHLRIAQGPLNELETQCMICERVGLATNERVEPLHAGANAIGRMIRSFTRTLQD